MTRPARRVTRGKTWNTRLASSEFLAPRAGCRAGRRGRKHTEPWRNLSRVGAMPVHGAAANGVPALRLRLRVAVGVGGRVGGRVWGRTAPAERSVRLEWDGGTAVALPPEEPPFATSCILSKTWLQGESSQPSRRPAVLPSHSNGADLRGRSRRCEGKASGVSSAPRRAASSRRFSRTSTCTRSSTCRSDATCAHGSARKVV